MLEVKLASERAIVKRKIAEAKQDLKINQQKYAQYQTLHLEDRVSYDKYHTGKLELHTQLVEQAETIIAESEAKLVQLKTALPTKKQFFELTQSHLLELLNTDDLVKIDAIANEVVANLRAGDNAVSVIKLNPPYNLLVDLGDNLSWSRNDDLMQTHLDTLHQLLLNSQLMKQNLAKAVNNSNGGTVATSMSRFLL
jgi:hypothetical protein